MSLTKHAASSIAIVLGICPVSTLCIAICAKQGQSASCAEGRRLKQSHAHLVAHSFTAVSVTGTNMYGTAMTAWSVQGCLHRWHAVRCVLVLSYSCHRLTNFQATT